MDQVIRSGISIGPGCYSSNCKEVGLAQLLAVQRNLVLAQPWGRKNLNPSAP